MRLRFRVVGQVQGVGFRPWVLRRARELGLSGWVRNGADGVWVEAQGERVQELLGGMARAPLPIRAEVVERAEIPAEAATTFAITPSEPAGDRRPTLPPDLATCEACRAEVHDPGSRRLGYLLLSCTACGPRYSIAGGPPFDRERTAMAAFPLCSACRVEYHDPDDRRFHAQATACAACGPRLSMSVAEATEVVLGGGVLAVKGLAGFQLLCDAGNEAAVARLRGAKARPDKPLAVLADPAAVRGLTSLEVAVLEGPDAPIVLCDAVLDLAPSVLRGVRSVGLMGPSTAVHGALLASVGRPMVCTSANRSGEPLATRAANAGTLSDATWSHDRPVWRGADDSVVRVVRGRVRVLRRARGHAPAPLALGREGPPLLALGADLESAVALALGDQAVLSPYLGRLGSRSMQGRLEHEIQALCDGYGVQPEGVVCDAHPDLVSSQTAAVLARRWGVPLTTVQHHHAHAAAVCAEHGLEGPVLALAWDGVGLGSDGATWGGEVLQVDGGTCERVAHLRLFALPGGDQCAREPGRTALSLLHAAGLDPIPELHPRAAELWSLLEGTPRTCSAMGRLFDGVAVLCGLSPQVSFEAQLPLALEELASTVESREHYEQAEDCLDWRPWIRGVVRDREEGIDPAVIARRFHESVLEALVRVVGPAERVVLGGGCFHNRLLVGGAVDRLGSGRVWLGERVPSGDGGIALGQAWVARRRGG